MGGVNKHEPGESYSKLYFFFRLNGSHTYVPLLIQMMPLVTYFLKFYSPVKIVSCREVSIFINFDSLNSIYSILSVEQIGGFLPN